ncbi:TetR/AcrR family transcriptional regulator [Prauserella cavernicola]|uniref:TetR/AcrR family transcriptional regulator n=1 Tax=Prauserella cavernicola TaxID=2800127 RepID=A0A934V2Z1_9PSEU|nr:TetR/AcrR family transcriptional regulator [Prauserella cavernicola]MBK1786641.1 TetR/AcrR family transcriptional regulator [Prauserella cavernicola]
MSTDSSHALRSDALDNRRRIIEAARSLFAAEGMDVPMRTIARRAGVGPATLYRRFPAKQDLVAEAFEEEARRCHAIVDEGLAEPDPWRGFCRVIERTCELHARNRGFTEAFLSTLAGQTELMASRKYILDSVATLAARAKETGRLRADFVVDDLVLMLMAHRGVRMASEAAQLAASRRFAALTIQAFRASPDHVE